MPLMIAQVEHKLFDMRGIYSMYSWFGGGGGTPSRQSHSEWSPKKGKAVPCLEVPTKRDIWAPSNSLGGDEGVE